MQGASTDAEQQQLFAEYQSIMEGVFLKQQQQAGTDGPVVTLQELAEQLHGQEEGACEEVRGRSTGSRAPAACLDDSAVSTCTVLQSNMRWLQFVDTA